MKFGHIHSNQSENISKIPKEILLDSNFSWNPLHTKFDLTPKRNFLLKQKLNHRSKLQKGIWEKIDTKLMKAVYDIIFAFAAKFGTLIGLYHEKT